MQHNTIPIHMSLLTTLQVGILSFFFNFFVAILSPLLGSPVDFQMFTSPIFHKIIFITHCNVVVRSNALETLIHQFHISKYSVNRSFVRRPLRLSVWKHFAMALSRRTVTHGQILNKILRENSEGRRRFASDNISVVQEEFTKQAAVFENKWNQRMKRNNKEIMGWVIGKLGNVSKEMKALDVASGTGIFARTLAPLCRSLKFEEY